jgi:hypothetical protein
MVTPAARHAVPLGVTTDPDHGGRWTSLAGGGREWLWHRAEPRRPHAAPGDPFADAGGLEECVPTVRGRPDHGDAWTRRWRRADGDPTRLTVDCPDFTLTRRLRVEAGQVVADYRLTAAPGYRFVWAAHALLDLSPRAVLRAEPGTRTRLFPEAAGLLADPWPPGARWVAGEWPTPAGLRLDRLGPDDGTAVGAVLATGSAEVHDGGDVLTMSLEADGQPVSIALWRNLGGFPDGAVYRSVGVEPMLGRVFDLADAGDASAGAGAADVGAADAAVVPAGGAVRWRLTIRADRRAA